MSIKVAELLCTQLLGLSKVGVLKMTDFFRDRRSSWPACVALAFPCGPVWFWSKERGTRVKDRAKNRASNGPFYRYGGHIELIRFKEYSGKRRSLLHPNTAQGSFFSLQSYSKKTLRKNVPKSARKYNRINSIWPPYR